MKRILLAICCFVLVQLHGQTIHMDIFGCDDFGVSLYLENTPQQGIDSISEYTQLENIRVNPDSNTFYNFPIIGTHPKTGKQHIASFFCDYDQERNIVNETGFDSIIFPTKLDYELQVIRFIDEGKYGIITQEKADKNYKKRIVNMYDSLFVVDPGDDEYGNYQRKILVRQDGKWGSVSYTGQVEYPFIFDDYREIPSISIEWDYLKAFNKFRKKHKLDLMIPVPQNHSYIKCRSGKTHKWGLASKDVQNELILKCEYDSIVEAPTSEHEWWFNYKDGKKGLYCNEEVQFDAQYDEIQLVWFEFLLAICLKSEGKWEAFDEEGNKMTDKKQDSIDALQKDWIKHNVRY